MTTKAMSEVVQHLCRTALRDRAGRTDEQLLEDYLGRRDDTALAALVRRHGPMVWAVCRRILGDEHDAEDAFQATFLVLVRRAGAIACRRLLANWLYGVAQRTALKARAGIARRKERERPAAVLLETAAPEARPWPDLGAVVDEELGRLPDKYRAVVVLCDLQGRTRKEAARQLNVPEGTVAGRLARARQLLARRLQRRGVEVSGGVLAALLGANAVSAGVPAPVLATAVRLVRGVGSGRALDVPLRVALLAQDTITTGLAPALVKAAAAVMLVAAVLAGAWRLSRAAPATDGGRAGQTPEGTALLGAAVGKEDREGAASEAGDPVKRTLAAVVRLDIEYAGTLERGSAVGIAVDPKGYVLTARRPFQGAKRARALLTDGSIMDMAALREDAVTGLALVELDKPLPPRLPVARLDWSGQVRVGERLWLGGEPPGAARANPHPRPALVTALDRSGKLERRLIGGLVQVDQPVKAGTPLVREDGELAGMVIVPSQPGTALGLALTASRMHLAYQRMREMGQPPQPLPPKPSDIRVDTRTMMIPVRVEEERKADLSGLHLSMSTDGGRTWSRVGTLRPTETAFRFTAPGDGAYWLTVQIERRDGTLEPASASLGGRLKIVVDTSKRDAQGADRAP